MTHVLCPLAGRTCVSARTTAKALKCQNKRLTACVCGVAQGYVTGASPRDTLRYCWRPTAEDSSSAGGPASWPAYTCTHMHTCTSVHLCAHKRPVQIRQTSPALDRVHAQWPPSSAPKCMAFCVVQKCKFAKFCDSVLESVDAQLFVGTTWHGMVGRTDDGCTGTCGQSLPLLVSLVLPCGSTPARPCMS